MHYDRSAAVAYARKWAFGRNPEYYDFGGIGGDCTNFVSQCLYAGAGVMNFTPELGWYYLSPDDRAPAWTGVIYLHQFLITNRGPGPFGEERPLYYAEPGDVVQMIFDGRRWSHTMLVTGGGTYPGDILLATHSYNAFDRPMDTYAYQLARLIHISGVRA